jgi:hypothetical protein
MKAIMSETKSERVKHNERKAQAVQARSPIGAVKVALNRYAEKNPDKAGKIIKAGEQLEKKTIEGIAKAKRIRKGLVEDRQALRKLDTRLKDGSTMTSANRKIFKEYYKK